MMFWPRTPNDSSSSLPDLHRDGAESAQCYSRWLYPMYGIDAAYLDLAARLARTTAPAVRNGVLERGDLMHRMLRARAG